MSAQKTEYMDTMRKPLRLCLHLSMKLQVRHTRKSISDFVITSREQSSPLIELYRHIGRELNITDYFSVYPTAVCRPKAYNPDLLPPGDNQACTHLPLVCEELWKHLVNQYTYTTVKVVIEPRPHIHLSKPIFTCIPHQHKELKKLDIQYYFPRKFTRKNLIQLSELIYSENYYIRNELRRGVWMHLLGVFHGDLNTEEQRESYLCSLRRVYDNLKGKWLGDECTLSPEVLHLRESIRRDAIRTDPTETFLTVVNTEDILEDNVQKLIDIIMIYTLEHKDIKYTQGMTDLLSPILYVMKREDDAYICFSAMFERLKDNFSEWCEGALNKLERLRHLCEVLDPQLYHHLTHNNMDDPFVLFFGMVLIECRREFNFSDSLHLLEVLWSAALFRSVPSLNEVSKAQWASFMTTESMNVVCQVFGEERPFYSAQPLLSFSSRSSDGAAVVQKQRHGSSSHDSYTPSEAREIPGRKPSSTVAVLDTTSSTPPPTSSAQLNSFGSGRDRSSSLPESVGESRKWDGTGKSPPILPEAKSDGSIPHLKAIANEHSSSFTKDFQYSGNHAAKKLPNNNEMSDLSSISSANSNVGILRNSAHEECSPAVIRKVSSGGAEGLVKNGSPLVNRSRAVIQQDVIKEESERAVDSTGDESLKGSVPQVKEISELKEHNMPILIGSYTLPKQKRKENDEQNTNTSTAQSHFHTLPRAARDNETTPTAPPTSEFIRHLSNPLISSPYVSAIRPLDRFTPPTRQIESESTHGSNYIDPYTSLPLASQSDSRLSPLPPFFDAMDKIASDPSSLEASIEVSQIVSQLVSVEQSRPNVNLESSLKIKMADSYSLFVCLALLVANRDAILSNNMDFVALSVHLNTHAGSISLHRILQIARSLHKTYKEFQYSYYSRRFVSSNPYETWLDDLVAVSVETPMTTPLGTPSSIRRSSSINY